MNDLPHGLMKSKCKEMQIDLTVREDGLVPGDLILPWGSQQGGARPKAPPPVLLTESAQQEVNQAKIKQHFFSVFFLCFSCTSSGFP